MFAVKKYIQIIPKDGYRGHSNALFIKSGLLKFED